MRLGSRMVGESSSGFGFREFFFSGSNSNANTNSDIFSNDTVRVWGKGFRLRFRGFVL